MSDNATWWVIRFYDALKSLAEPYKDMEPVKEETDHIVTNIWMDVTPKHAMIIIHLLEREVDRIKTGENNDSQEKRRAGSRA